LRAAFRGRRDAYEDRKEEFHTGKGDRILSEKKFRTASTTGCKRFLERREHYCWKREKRKRSAKKRRKAALLGALKRTYNNKGSAGNEKDRQPMTRKKRASRQPKKKKEHPRNRKKREMRHCVAEKALLTEPEHPRQRN